MICLAITVLASSAACIKITVLIILTVGQRKQLTQQLPRKSFNGYYGSQNKLNLSSLIFNHFIVA